MKYIHLLRLKHSVKNALIFLPLFFGREMLSVALFFRVFLAAMAFTCACSFVYILNDLRDIEKDRKHPVKCKRPLASGAVSIKTGKQIGVIMLAGAYIILFSAKMPLYAYVWLTVYIVLNILYSFKLKNVALVDIAILTSGFVIRILYGSAVTGIVISDWMYLTIFSASLYMALGKRRNELRNSEGGQTRAVLKKYNYAFLDKCMYVALTMALVFYSLWVISEYTGTLMILSIPIVVFICLLYSLIIEGDSQGDPVEVILNSPAIVLLTAIWGILVSFCLYF